MSDIPSDLHELEYARAILENLLGWPAKSNLEVMADCLKSIGNTKKLTPFQSYRYMLRALELAKLQGIRVTKFWLLEGEYMNIRPPGQGRYKDYVNIDRKAVEAEQATPEWQEANRKLLATLARIAGKKAM